MSFYGAWSAWQCRTHDVWLGPLGHGDPSDCFAEDCEGDAFYGNGMDRARLHKVLGKGGWYVPPEEAGQATLP